MHCWPSTTIPTTSTFTEDGLAQCIDLVDAALRRSANGHALGDDWLVGTGTASSIHETAPPTEHISEAWATLRDDGMYEIAVGTVEFGEGTSTAHVQIAADAARHDAVADPPRAVRHRPDRLRHRRLRQRGAVRLGQRGAAGVDRLARPHPALRRRARRRRRRRRARWTTTESSAATPACRWPSSLEAARARGIRFTEARKAYGSPRSVTSNTHGFRIAVHRITGEIRILYSVQATDAGVVINPAQVRGQVEGGVAQGIGFALTENFHVDANGVMVNPNLRNYRIPTYADIPRTEVLLVDSTDSVGPMRSKGMAECCINPVAPALANALAGRDRGALPRAAAHPRAHLQPTRPEPLARDDVSREKRAMDTKKPTDTAATVIIGQRIRAGSELEYEAWQEEMNREASKYPGFLGAEINPPTARAARMGRGVPLRLHRPRPGLDQQRARGRSDWPPVSSIFDGPGTQQVLGGGARPTDPLVTVVVTHRVSPENVEDFLAWQDRLRVGGERVRGLPRDRAVPPGRGCSGGMDHALPLRERDRPRQVADVEGAPGPSRRGREVLRLPLQHHRQLVRQLVRLRRARQPGAAALGNQDVPSRCGWASTRPWCCSASRCRRCSMPLWLSLLVGNLLSSFAMTFVTMPYYVNPLLKHWLRPPPDMPAARTNWRGIGIVAAVTAFWVVVFYLVTTQL